MQRSDEIDALAKQNYYAFLKQLEYVGARIPTQSMQSFMGLRVVDFSESDVNEVYIPSSMQWLEGSKIWEYIQIKISLIGTQNLVNCGKLLKIQLPRLAETHSAAVNVMINGR